MDSQTLGNVITHGEGEREGGRREIPKEGGEGGGIHWCKLCVVGYFTFLLLSTVARK